MHPVVEELLKRLSKGEGQSRAGEEAGRSVVGVLARVYEKARNAMEYRADHLVRRAAIERILKRQLIFRSEPLAVARELMLELKWAKYLRAIELEQVTIEMLEAIFNKYFRSQSARSVPFDWLIGAISAEIEEAFNLNTDYRKFTTFAYQAIKQKVKISGESNLDLLTYVAVDRIFTQSDEAQVAYHLIRLMEPKWDEVTEDRSNTIAEAYKLQNMVSSHKLMGKLTRYVRQQSPPLVLLRDIYFADPKGFYELLTDREKFDIKAREVLTVQLTHMSKIIRTAAIRSIVYVFLTKMLFGLLVEAPIDRLLEGRVHYFPLAINLIFPPVLMWLMSSNISLPGADSQSRLVSKAWQTVADFDSLAHDRDALENVSKRRQSIWYTIFSAIYLIIFWGLFVLIIYILDKIGFTLASMGIFIFFLTVVAFFAYRIRQAAQVYSYKNDSGLGDTIMLPLLAVGAIMNQGLVKLNFLAFVFDFILEAPYKTILRILDSWVQFLSAKKEEVVG